MAPSALSDVVLAISSFRSEEAVLNLLAQMFASPGEGFGAVLVIDSLGSGTIERAIEERGWPVHYSNADSNLGSAGNLALRLQTASETGFGWCYAVNHDGEVDQRKVKALLELGLSRERVGAVYPTLILSSADNRIDAARTGFAPFAKLSDTVSSGGVDEVAWSSSNCALYNLDAVRQGAAAWAELWMGWEDLELGWRLRKSGWLQLRSRSVTVVDTYEYRRVSVVGRHFFTAAKPAWYSYYQLRNLVLIARRTRFGAVGPGAIVRRMLVDIGLTLFVRPQKFKRLMLLFRGLIDGLRGRSGMGPVP
ncbi:MAG: hypothetical protein ABI422_07220 [Sphingomicrobium sp.]